MTTFLRFHCLNCDSFGAVLRDADRVRCEHCDSLHFLGIEFWRTFRENPQPAVASFAIVDQELLKALHGENMAGAKRTEFLPSRPAGGRAGPDPARSAPASRAAPEQNSENMPKRGTG